MKINNNHKYLQINNRINNNIIIIFIHHKRKFIKIILNHNRITLIINKIHKVYINHNIEQLNQCNQLLHIKHKKLII